MQKPESFFAQIACSSAGFVTAASDSVGQFFQKLSIDAQREEAAANKQYAYDLFVQSIAERRKEK